MAFTQTHRVLSLTTPLGPDALLIEGLSGQESISSLFSFTLFLLSESQNISFAALVGQPATIHIETADDGQRYINGIISQVSQGHRELRFTRYHAVLVPWLWNLTRAADCRIFQNKSVPDIIKEVFEGRGFKDFRLKLSQQYQPREYCVQYHETDFDFVSRLMEEEGIFYFFEHASDKHTLVLGDSPSAHQSCPGQSSVPYNPHGGPQAKNSISGWLQEQEVRPAKYALTDYNFETPSTSLAVNVPTLVREGRNDKLEIYDYPGEYQNKGEGERYVKLRMEEQETPHTRISGASDCRSFIPGFTFNLTDHYRSDYNGSYLLTSVSHQAAGNLRTGGGDASYSNSFTCIPSKVPYRPLRVAPKPIMRGLQTAVVVGPSGEEIYTDKYGRVRVQFHWDRKGKKDEKSSCWIRVAQLWAGKNWGAIHIPRIGQEVIVDFLEGDPDRPIITGRVYNAEQMPPYELPGNQTQSGIKSRSSKGGGAANFNEIRFEDKKGQEELYVHAERDLTVMVEHDETKTVQHDQKLTVQNDRTATVSGTDSETIARTQTCTVGSSRTTTIASSDTLTVGGPITINCAASATITCGATTTITSGGPVTITAPMIVLNAAMVQVSGVLQCTTLITTSVVSPVYTPGVGNLL